MTSAKWIDGKLALLVVLGLGVAGAAGGWWYQQGLQRRPIRLWGYEAATLFISAPHVELWRLEPGAEAADVMIADGEGFRAVEKVDVSQAHGFLHLRHSLLSDPSFDWSSENSRPKGWRFALRFSDGSRIAMLLISEDFQHAMLAETRAEASIAPIADGVKKLFEEQLGRGSPALNNGSRGATCLGRLAPLVIQKSDLGRSLHRKRREASGSLKSDNSYRAAIRRSPPAYATSASPARPLCATRRCG